MTYVEQMGELMKALLNHGLLEKYRDAFLARIETTARDQVACNEDHLMHALRGQMTICLEQVDAANQALAAKTSEAKDGSADGIPEWP